MAKDKDELFAQLQKAAIEAEFESGEREETVAEAKAHVAVRLGRMALGFVVLILGIAMLALPGPGVLAIAGGLFILAKDVAWADRLLQYLRKRVPGIPDDGKIPRSQIITMAVMAVGAIAASVWWFVLRDQDPEPAAAALAWWFTT